MRSRRERLPAVNRSSHLLFRPGTRIARRRFGGMEYEISDQGEAWLFDDSTNPSLQPVDKPDAKRGAVTGPRPEPADKRKLQRAEFIPEEEEHQLA